MALRLHQNNWQCRLLYNHTSREQAVRKCIDATLLNDRDQFLFPNDDWDKDGEFQNNCLVYTLFTNNIQSAFGANHWIPFSEQELNTGAKFESDFISKFIKGKIDTEVTFDLFNKVEKRIQIPLLFLPEASAVLDAGREIWKYYHKTINSLDEFAKLWQPIKSSVNASLYDIREYFQGRNAAGKMNNKSDDKTCSLIMVDLRIKLKVLARK